MDNISIFFIIISLFAMAYIIYILRTSKRLSLLLEIAFIGAYSCVMIIFLFPQILIYIEKYLGISSAINFIIYLSIFIAYFLIFILYKKSEDRRIEITKLVREIAYLKNRKKKKNNN